MDKSRRHQGDTKTFEELTFAEQAKSINISVVGLQRSVAAHLRRATQEGRDPRDVRLKCVNQIQRLIDRLS